MLVDNPYAFLIVAIVFTGAVLAASELLVTLLTVFVQKAEPIYQPIVDRWLPGRRIRTGDVDLFADALNKGGAFSTHQIEHIRVIARRLQNRRALLETLVRAAGRANLPADANVEAARHILAALEVKETVILAEMDALRERPDQPAARALLEALEQDLARGPDPERHIRAALDAVSSASEKR